MTYCTWFCIRLCIVYSRTVVTTHATTNGASGYPSLAENPFWFNSTCFSTSSEKLYSKLVEALQIADWIGRLISDDKIGAIGNNAKTTIKKASDLFAEPGLFEYSF